MTPDASLAAARLPGRSGVRAPSLPWSEQLYLACIAAAALLTVSRFIWPLERIPYFKHLPWLATLPVLALTLAGARLATRPDASRPVPGAFAVAWPLGLLALLVVGGSLYARLVAGVQSTFLNMGLYMSLVFAAAAMVSHSAAPERLLRAYTRILLLAALAMALGLMVYFRRREVYHEEIFLVIPLGVYCFLAWRGAAARWGALAFFLALALLSAKNTSYLVALMTMGYLGLVLGLPRAAAAPPLRRLWGYYLAFVVLALVAAVVAYLLYFRDVYLPSGNVAYRSHTYGLAWQKFLASPGWGTLFAEESVKKFTLYSIGIARNILPTHSDIMDLLAHGGLLAVGLWALGLARIAAYAWRRLLAPRWLGHPWAAHGHAYAMVSLAAVATYAFNPLMLQPGMAYLLWTTLGFLLGAALRRDGTTEEEACDFTPSGKMARRQRS